MKRWKFKLAVILAVVGWQAASERISPATTGNCCVLDGNSACSPTHFRPIADAEASSAFEVPWTDDTNSEFDFTAPFATP
ncbi:MAG: hypothetical protein AAGG44_05995 [Planctomycetota bacterium]